MGAFLLGRCLLGRCVGQAGMATRGARAGRRRRRRTGGGRRARGAARSQRAAARAPAAYAERSRAVSRSSIDSPGAVEVTRCVPGAAPARMPATSSTGRPSRVVAATASAGPPSRSGARCARAVPGRPVGLAAPVPLDDRRLEAAGRARTSPPRSRRAGGTAPRRGTGSARRPRPRRRPGAAARTAARPRPSRSPRGRTPGCPPSSAWSRFRRTASPRGARRRRRRRAARRPTPTVDRPPDDDAGRGRRRPRRPRSRRAEASRAIDRGACIIRAIPSRIRAAVPEVRRITKAAAPSWCPRPLGASGPGGSVVVACAPSEPQGPSLPAGPPRASASRRKAAGEVRHGSRSLPDPRV